MHVGHYTSGVAHLALLGWLVFGGVFASEPLPIKATEVSVISGEEFAALAATRPAPQSVTDVAQPASPEVTQDAPEISARSDAATELATPDSTPVPEVERTPDVSLSRRPPARAHVGDTAPALGSPPEDLAVLVPDVAERPVPQAAARVAPQAVEAPDPDAQPDPVAQDAVRPDESGTEQQETQEATAPEAAATEIVTEAERPARAPERSPRPRVRPDPPVRTAAPAPEPQEPPVSQSAPDTPEAAAPAQEPAPDLTPDSTSDAVTAALAEALAAPSSAPATPSGPPLSAGEKDALRIAVSDCWNVHALSTDARRTTVVVTFNMTQDGKPVDSSVRMLSSSGGSAEAAAQAFKAARRAIIRCGAPGFDLPVEKFDQWQEIEMTFNFERMRDK